MNLRHNRVLPVPTSPVILMKPSPPRAATSSVFRASWEPGLPKKKLVSGVMPNGASRRPKWVVYMSASSPRARIELLDAAACIEQVVVPVAGAFDDGRLDQHHQLALLVHPLPGAEQRAQHRHPAGARQLGH